jgi:signal transduction histidine kinase
LNPELDFLSMLFMLLCAQAALVFPSRTCWVWVCILIFLLGGSLMVTLGALRGLALGLTTMAGCIIIPAYFIANQEIGMAQVESQAMLSELERTHQQLQAYAGQVEELAAIEERNRLARELHDSISQTIFSIILNTRSAQILVQRDPARVRPQLEQLQSLAQDALAEMRSMIAQLRPS